MLSMVAGIEPKDQTEAMLGAQMGAVHMQMMTVEHVHVHDGGQAIVGQVAQGGGATEKDKGQSHAYAITHAPQPTLRSEDQKKDAVPVTSDAKR